MSTPAPNSHPTILFAGLGAMGHGMATQLLRSNFPLIAHDIHPPTLQRFLLSNPGAASADTALEGAKTADVMVVMVANHSQVDPLLFDPVTGAAPALKRGAVVIICSTVSPAYVVSVSDRMKGETMGRQDVVIVDCPVSGGPVRASQGTLSIFSSSSDDDDDNVLFGAPHVRSVLSCLSDTDGKKLYRVPGGLGAGSKAKLVHQMFAGVHIALASEVMGLAAVSGLDTRGVYEELKRGEGDSWIFGNRVRYMLDPEGEGRYSAASLINKDMGIVSEMARREGFAVPLVGVAEQLFLSAVANGWATEDDWVVVRLYLGKRPGLVVERVGRQDVGVGVGVSVDELTDLLIGVHLAVMSEAMGFCEVLGIDADLMFDIVNNAAGASKVFAKYFRDLKGNGWRVKGVKGVEGIRDRLMNAVAKARQQSYPLFLSTAALQELNRQLR